MDVNATYGCTGMMWLIPAYMLLYIWLDNQPTPNPNARIPLSDGRRRLDMYIRGMCLWNSSMLFLDRVRHHYACGSYRVYCTCWEIQEIQRNKLKRWQKKIVVLSDHLGIFSRRKYRCSLLMVTQTIYVADVDADTRKYSDYICWNYVFHCLADSVYDYNTPFLK